MKPPARSCLTHPSTPLLSLPGSLGMAFCSRSLPQVPEHPLRHACRRDVAEPQTDTLDALRPRPQQAARPVTHLLARLGRRLIVGCGAGCRCHGVGQILGRSIRLGVIHHLRTTHGSRGSGGPRAAAAALRAGARGAGAAAAAAAASVAAPAATAAKAGPRRPRAPRGARGREGLAISGGPCAGTFIFSPSGCPLPRLYSGSGTQPPAAPLGHYRVRLPRGLRRPRQRQSQPQPRPGSGSCGEPGSGLHIHNARPGLVLSRVLPAVRGPGGGGRGRGNAGEAGEHFASPGSDAELCKVSPTRFAAGGSPCRGTPGKAGCGLERSLQPSPPPSMGWWWEGNGMQRLRALKARQVPTLSLSPGRQGEGFPTPRRFYKEHQLRGWDQTKAECTKV